MTGSTATTLESLERAVSPSGFAQDPTRALGFLR
jgi:hypothetical protein